MSQLRTCVYIDGFNLYYGQLKGTSYKWLNLLDLCRSYLDETKNLIVKIKYFTARVKSRPGDPDQSVRQHAYLRALQTLPDLEIIYGHFLSHNVSMPRADGTGYVNVIKTEEKKSDVNIAVHILNDAYKDVYDLAVLVSNDSDLSEPLRIVTQEMNKKVGILNPHKTTSNELARYAIFQKKIRSGALSACQFPFEINDQYGIIRKPSSW